MKNLFLMNDEGIVRRINSLRNHLNIDLLTVDTHGGQGRLLFGRRGLKLSLRQ